MRHWHRHGRGGLGGHPHWQHHHHRPWRFFGPLGYVRARLQRRLFFWFGGVIICTTIVAAIVAVRVASHGYNREFEGMRHLFATRFERVWDDPPGRDELGESIARDLGMGIDVRASDGRLLAHYGGACEPHMQLNVERAGQRLGTVSGCSVNRHRGFLPFASALAVFIGILWGATGALARRIAGPIVEVARVAEEIGRGQFSSRVHMHGRPRAYGEAMILGDAINTMAERIEQQFRDQKELMAAVSHEVRTPLARMRLLIELARESGVDPARINELEREVIDMDTLVGELLANSRLDFGVLSPVRIDLGDLVRRELERHGVLTNLFHSPIRDRFVVADATLLARAIGNLIGNAKAHGGGVVAVRLTDNDDQVTFEVEDEGPGIPAGDEERIFQPFYRAASDPNAGSLGLGLSLVRRIAHAHRGEAYARVRSPKGTAFGFTIARSLS